MCWCDPRKRTPFCGNAGCHPPGGWLAKPDVPTIPALTPAQKKDRDISEQNPVVAKCGECGIHLRVVMHLACTNEYCPVTERPK